MGISYQFNCKYCGYEAVVSGGDDIGMHCSTTTITCQDCGELFDLKTSDEPWGKSASLPDEELVCPGAAPDHLIDGEGTDRSNQNHRVRRWAFPGSCPKCGQAMTKGEVELCWD